ncbi:MAG: response regulator [Myxococcales bacterium]|nr:response regulator [Myxococcales bacterium]
MHIARLQKLSHLTRLHILPIRLVSVHVFTVTTDGSGTVIGVPILDAALGDAGPGLPVVLFGPIGCGRTVFALHVAHAASLRGERVVFVAAEPPQVLLRQAESLNLDLRPAIESERVALLHLVPQIATLLRSHGADGFVEKIREEMETPDALVFDPLTALTSEFLDEQPLRSALTTLFGGVGAPRVVATAESSALESQPILARALSDLCGALVELGRNERGHRFLEVQKSRFGANTASKLHFSISPGGVHARDPEASAEPEAATPAPAEAVPARRRRVLLIDAEGEERDQLEEWISAHHDVEVASTGFGALSSLLANPPELIVVDPVVPDVAGFELLSALRRAPVEVPILVVSQVMARAANRMRAMVLGAADVLSKPPSPIELERKLALLAQLPTRPRNDSEPEPDILHLTLSPDREVSEEEFTLRMKEALEFGKAYGVDSTLVRLRFEEEELADAIIAASQRLLRPEDAALRFEPEGIALLLIAASVYQAPAVLARLLAAVDEKEDAADQIVEQLSVPIDDALLARDWRSGPLGPGGAEGDPACDD